MIPIVDQVPFEELLNRNVKLVTLGCDLDTVTFVHYVEQKTGLVIL